MDTQSYLLNRKWAIWELWGLSKDENFNSAKNMQKIGEFDNVHEFWQYWNYIPHASPSTLFENPETRMKVLIETLNISIEAIAVFESPLQPIHEDPANKSGSNFFFEVDSQDYEFLKKIWNNLVLGLIGETFPCSLDISGCRIVDKGRSVKFEIWTKFDGSSVKNSTKNLMIREGLKKWFDVGDTGVLSHSQI